MVNEVINALKYKIRSIPFGPAKAHYIGNSSRNTMEIAFLVL